MITGKVGFACKIHTGIKDTESLYNFNTTTVKAVSAKTLVDRVSKLQSLGLNNIYKLATLIKLVGEYPEARRMMRIGSDLLPLYTHPCAREAYADKTFVLESTKLLAEIGSYARNKNIRLSMHPGQFTVLGSFNQNTVEASIAELEYHTNIFMWMGYSGWHEYGTAINIHGGSGKVPLDVFVANMNKCSEQCRQFLTVENDEFSFDIRSLTTISTKISIVPDLHHEWIHNGHYLDRNDSLFEIVQESWRGVRPKLHCAMSREELLMNIVGIETLPSLNDCLAMGLTKSALRAHSDSSWNKAIVAYYAQFLDEFDIMCEMKHKQEGAEAFLNYL